MDHLGVGPDFAHQFFTVYWCLVGLGSLGWVSGLSWVSTCVLRPNVSHTKALDHKAQGDQNNQEMPVGKSGA